MVNLFSMVDMKNVDLANINGQTIVGLYSSLTGAISSHLQIILYNWRFAGMPMPPGIVNLVNYTGYVLINNYIKVTYEDKIYMVGWEPDPIVSVSALIESNGTFLPSQFDADYFDEIETRVPNTYTEADEGKVVNNGALVSQTSATKTENGVYDTTLNNEIVVNVSGSDILSGTSVPSASLGSNGAIYLQYREAAQLPSGFIQLKYVETNAGSQYVNLGYAPKTNTRVVLETEISYGYGSNGGFLLGERNSTYSNNASFEITPTGTTTGINRNITLNGSGGTVSNAFSYYDQLVIIEATRSNLKVKVDGEIVIDISITNATAVDATLPIYLFALNPYGSSTGLKCKLYNMSIYEGDTLVHNYIPVKDTNDVACLYDVVTEEALYSATSTQLIAGVIFYEEIISSYLKVNGTWQNLIGSNINDVSNG